MRRRAHRLQAANANPLWPRPLPPNRQVLKPQLPHQLRLVEVAAIEDHEGLQGGFDGFAVGAAELAPLGQDDQRIVTLQHRRLAVLMAIWRAFCPAMAAEGRC